MIKIQSEKILYTILLWSFIASCCHYTNKTKNNSHEDQIEIYKFDAARIVNIVLDSTNIADFCKFDNNNGRFAIYRNDFIIKYNVQIANKRFYLSDDCDSLEHSIEARLGKCWFLEFIQIDSISEDIYRIHYAIPYKSRGGFYDFDINDYAITDSFKVRYKPKSDTTRYIIWNK